METFYRLRSQDIQCWVEAVIDKFPSAALRLFTRSLGSFATLQNLFPYLKVGVLKRLLKAISEWIHGIMKCHWDTFILKYYPVSSLHLGLQSSDSLSKETLQCMYQCLRQTWICECIHACQHVCTDSHSKSRICFRMSCIQCVGGGR